MESTEFSSLLQIEERDGQELIDARALHAALEVGTHFREWIRRRIRDFEFVEGRDYITFVTNLGKTQMGRPSKTYGLTLRMAKHLAMIEKNERGKEVRKYFIEREKEFRKIRDNYPEALREFADKVEARLELEQKKQRQLGMPTEDD